MADLFSLNQEFNNHEEFNNHIIMYQDQTNFSLSKYDSRKMVTHCSHMGKNANDYPNLDYYYYYLRCSRGGQFKSKKKDGVISRKVKSNKNGCPVKLHVTANLHKKLLVVSKWISDHNHLPENNDLALDGSHQDNNDNDVSDETFASDEERNTELEVAAEKKKNLKSSRYNTLSMSEIFQKFERSIAYDDSTTQTKKDMLVKLLHNFEKLDKKKKAVDKHHPKVSSGKESSHVVVPSSVINSPPHLELLPSTSPPASQNGSTSTVIQLQHSNLPTPSKQPSLVSTPAALKSPSDLDHELSSKISISKPIVELKQNDIQSNVCGRPKRQIKPTIGAEYETYGVKKVKKRV